MDRIIINKYTAGFILVLLFLAPIAFAQSPGEELREGYQKRNSMAGQSLLKNYPARNIGPVVQGGRVVDIDVNTRNTNEYLVAYASGGVFKTANNGITFEPIFDGVDALGIGDIAMAPSDNTIIYIGTGEKNSSRSSYAGTGVYRSSDGGKTWQHLGLTDSQHISRVIVHPGNPDIVWVASLGALYSHNDMRGVFKTTDGGKTWNKTLFVNDSTGITDLVINPQNPDQLWAASWERTRKSWNFKGSGPGSRIYRSNNGGETWFKTMDGFPEGPQVGRIGLAVSPSSPNVVYAFLDNQAEKKEEKEDEEKKLRPVDFKTMTREAFMAMDIDELDEFLKDNGYPKKYNAERVKKEVSEGEYTLEDIANYFGDANANLFNTTVVGAELYRSDDGAITWKKMNSYDLEGVYFTYGYYFGEVRVSPTNPDQVYVFGVPLLKSNDSGVTYARIDSLGDVHVDHQALWINPADPDHLRLGNDGGLYESHDGGAYWRHINNMPVGQFYTVNVDMEKPYNVYGGLQDNGSLVGSSKSIPNRTAHWQRVFGGDGMFIAPDPRNADLVYTGFQFGNYYKKDRKTGETTKITPQHDIGAPKLRFNWRTPLVLSVHNPGIVYLGAQRLYRSMDQGENWTAISPDLTQDRPHGNVPFSTITEISESTLKFGLVYVGTDDGNVHVSTSAGDEWRQINVGLPKDKWVSSVFASPHDENHVFVTLNGYREDDFNAYAFVSEDQGKTWQSVTGSLPKMVVNDLIQDPVNPGLLYLGGDNGTYISLDRGASWQLVNAIPNVASYDLIVHPRDHELVVGTHGRSIFVMDVKPLQAVAGRVNEPIIAFQMDDITFSDQWGEKRYPYLEANTPGLNLKYYVGQEAGEIKIEVYNADNELVRTLSAPGTTKGFHSLRWDLKITGYSKKRRKVEPQPYYAPKGSYTLKFINGDVEDLVSLVVK